MDGNLFDSQTVFSSNYSTTIAIDAHLEDSSGLDFVKIMRKKPDQKVVMVTTSPKDYLSKDKSSEMEAKEFMSNH